jgi:hypothetical protein
MKPVAKFTTRDGLVMLLALTLMFAAILWLILSGLVRIND